MDDFLVDTLEFCWFAAQRGLPLVVYFAGIGAALFTLSRNKLPSLLTIIGCSLVLVSRLSVLFMFYRLSRDGGIRNAPWFEPLFAVADILIVVGCALIVFAVFAGRKKQTIAEAHP